MTLSGCLIFIAANSRTKMVSILFFLLSYYIIFFFFLNKENKEKMKMALIIAASAFFVIAILLAATYLFRPLRSYIATSVLRAESLKTASSRDEVFKVAYSLGKAHRLFGYNIELLSEKIAPHAHNMFL